MGRHRGFQTRNGLPPFFGLKRLEEAMELMSPLFTEAQRSVATHKKCVKALAAVRARADEDAFRAELVKCTNCVLLVYKREPVIERLVQFLVMFVTAEASNGSEGTDENSLLTFFVRAAAAPAPRAASAPALRAERSSTRARTPPRSSTIWSSATSARTRRCASARRR